MNQYGNSGGGHTGPQDSSPHNYPGNYPGNQQGGNSYPSGGPQQGYPSPQQGYGGQAPYGQQGYGPQYPAYRPQKPFSTKAIVSLVLGGAGLFLFPLGVITGIIGAIVGFMAMKETAEPEGTHRGRGLAVGGVITSICVWLICAAFCGFMAFAIVMAVEQESQRQTEWAQDDARTDLYTIRDRLELYYTENGRSLGPGGPVVNDGWDGGLISEDAPRVQGELRIDHLVREYDLHNFLYQYEIEVHSDTSATIYCRDVGLMMKINNMDNLYGASIKDIPGHK